MGIQKLDYRFGNKKMKKLDRDIVFLASFPRSGNTWMRFILANIFKKGGEKVNFKNIRDYMPTGYNDNLETTHRLLKDGYPFVIKRHRPYFELEKFPRKAIYIRRRKIDVLKSYWFYLRNEEPNLFRSIEDFVRCYNFKYGSWEEHIDSWQPDIGKKTRVLSIKYEDMKSNTINVVNKCLNFMDVNVEKERIEKAIDNSSYDKMKDMKYNKIYDSSYKENVETMVGIAHYLRFGHTNNFDLCRYLLLRFRSSLLNISPSWE